MNVNITSLDTHRDKHAHTHTHTHQHHTAKHTHIKVTNTQTQASQHPLSLQQHNSLQQHKGQGRWGSRVRVPCGGGETVIGDHGIGGKSDGQTLHYII